mmetsp:Transcript_53542/g.99034  ORF Transcript_53542/g.99034 Transcript_53542/m.99034 type:complete len:212 (+) Transcript_53542:452-1087(+)
MTQGNDTTAMVRVMAATHSAGGKNITTRTAVMDGWCHSQEVIMPLDCKRRDAHSVANGSNGLRNRFPVLFLPPREGTCVGEPDSLAVSSSSGCGFSSSGKLAPPVKSGKSGPAAASSNLWAAHCISMMARRASSKQACTASSGEPCSKPCLNVLCAATITPTDETIVLTTISEVIAAGAGTVLAASLAEWSTSACREAAVRMSSSGRIGNA